MENYKIFYGEYSLDYWIELILKKEIVLPPYQRNFVWDKKAVSGLMKNLQAGLFVPPVLIGTYIIQGQHEHLILDGHQRLSAILLSWLNLFPNANSDFSRSMEDYADGENDDTPEDDDSGNNTLGWKLTMIQAFNKKNKADILSALENDGRYHHIGEHNSFNVNSLNDDFFKNTCLGFSYIKPNTIVDSTAQKKYYSTVFRSININGKTLTKQESRESLYWFDDSLVNFFKPPFFNAYKVGNDKFDFARCLAILSEYYKKAGNGVRIDEYNVAAGYGWRRNNYNTIEDYVEKYIRHTVVDEIHSIFPSITDIIVDKNYTPRLTQLENTCRDLSISLTFTSIVVADYWMFGLIYHVFLCGKTIKTDEDSLRALRLAIEGKISSTTSAHSKSPAQLGFLRKRVFESISIYKDYINE